MDRTARLVSLIFFLILFSAAQHSPAHAATAPAPEVAEVSAAGTERLAQALERLTQLLETQAAAQQEGKQLRKLDIVIAYLNFRSRRIELMERDLNQKRTERDRYEDTLANWQKRQELFLKNLEESTPDEKKELEQALKEFDFQTKSLEQRLARAEEAIIIQENRIAELQEQLDSAEAYVQQHLEL
jgi:hypothetical protein